MHEDEFRALKERVERLERRDDDDVAISLMLYHVVEFLLEFVLCAEAEPLDTLSRLSTDSLAELDEAYERNLQAQDMGQSHNLFEQIIGHEESLWRAVRRRLEQA